MKTTKCKMILTIGLVCILATTILAGCSGRVNSSSSESAAEEPQSTMSEEAAEYAADEEGEVVDESSGALIADNAAIDNRKLIKTLDINMQTMEFDKTISSITDLVNELGGYIEQSNVSGNSLDYAGNYSENSYNPRSADFVLRIPVEKLDSASDKLDKLGNVTNRTESVEDVTSNYTDIERRLETLRVQEERLLEMLKTADELEYMIALEKELSDVRYEIEGYTSRLNGLDNQISYSFVYIYVNEVIKYDDVQIAPPTLGQRIVNGFSGSIRAISEIGETAIVGFASALPFLVVWGGALSLISVGIIKGKKLFRKKKHKGLHTPTQPNSPSNEQPEKTDTKR